MWHLGRERVRGIFAVLVFVFVFFFTRVPRLHNDTVNPDGVNWHYRSQMFMNGIKYNNLFLTYQHYHPGVTLMWITAPVIELYRQLPGNNTYNAYNFQGFDFVAKLAIVTVQLVLSLLCIYMLQKVVGLSLAYITVLLFSLEPFFVGNSRLFHMDVLHSLLVFLALVSLVAYLKQKTLKSATLVGLFLGLGLLTKTVSISVLVYTVVLVLLNLLFIDRSKKTLLLCGVIVISTIATTFILFPALWVRPIYVLTELCKESMRVGVRKGHEQLFFGNFTQDPGALFYPLVILLKTTPFLLVGILLQIILSSANNLKQLLTPKFYTDRFKSVLRGSSPMLLFAGFYLSYLVALTLSAKKLDRYMLVLYPWLAIVGTYGFNLLWLSLKQSRKAVAGLVSGLLFMLFVIKPLYTYFPYYFTYTSPFFGTADQANKIIGQKPFGIGMYDLRDRIINKYGSLTRVAFMDPKPMESIYPNSQVSDLRVDPMDRYDVAILGPNEIFPNKISRAEYYLIPDSSVYINGLEYWRLYVKKPK